MRLIKMALLAATAAVVAMAFIGASTASATKPWRGICLKNTPLNCAKADLAKHPLLGLLLASAGKGFFLSNFKIECESGEGKSNALESQNEAAVEGELESLTFAGCSGGCKQVKVITPVALTLDMTTDEGGWNLSTENAEVEFFECTFGVKCKFGGSLTLNVNTDAEGSYSDPEGKEFKLLEGSKLLCGGTGKWEEGRTRYLWTLDDGEDEEGNPVWTTTHKKIWFSLIGKELIKTF
jgi:hypothetical protein